MCYKSVVRIKEEALKLPVKPLTKPPKLAMMPSLKKSYQNKNSIGKRFPLPPGLVVEIGILSFTKLKHLLVFMQVSKLFYKECRQNNRLWYFVYSILNN